MADTSATRPWYRRRGLLRLTLAAWQGSPWQIPVTLGVFVVGSVCLLPVMALIVGVALVFGPGLGVLISLSGAMIAAIISYWLGALIAAGPRASPATDSRIARISRALGRRGMLTVISVRIVPVAPFGLINIACGASHIGFRDYVAGSFVGMGVMTVALSGGAAAVRAAATRPSAANIAVAGVVLLAAGLIVFTLHRRLGGPRPA